VPSALMPEGREVVCSPVIAPVKFALAFESVNVPVIPVAHNAGYIWPKGVFHKRPGLITMTIGAPISPAGKDPATLNQEVEAWIEDEVARLGVPS